MSTRFSLILATVVLSLVAASAPVVANEPSIDPDAAVSDENAVSNTDQTGATRVEPDPTVMSPRPHAWDHIVVSADGLTLSVYFYMGIEECHGLHSVTVGPTGAGIELQLQTGTPVGAGDTACIEIAQLYVTTVTLDEPLITNAA
ncbi:MAG: hypothetical protein R6W93_16235 [Candidatus Limnocylindrales bacterium]|jgi:hypothetical protein